MKKCTVEWTWKRELDKGVLRIPLPHRGVDVWKQFMDIRPTLACSATHGFSNVSGTACTPECDTKSSSLADSERGVSVSDRGPHSARLFLKMVVHRYMTETDVGLDHQRGCLNLVGGD